MTTPETESHLELPAQSEGHVARWKGSQFRFMRTTGCPPLSHFNLMSIDHSMDEAGIQSISNRQNKDEIFVAKALSKLGLVRNLRRSSSGPVFVTLIGFSESRTVPFSYWTEIVPYCFDCWPNLYDRWTSFFKRQRVRIAFFSAHQSAEYFAKTLPKMKSVWLPEAVSPSEICSSKSWPEKDIDVLELGRKNHAYHDRIVEPLAHAKRLHLYERVKGQIIFPDRSSFVDGIARSKLSICFPCSQTHPERSGSVETVTLRYFESMASKCIIVGHAPQELIDIFGYNPVIEAEEGNEFEQIESLLDNLDSFQGLVERNYNRLLEVGTWKSRVDRVQDVLCDFPF